MTRSRDALQLLGEMERAGACSVERSRRTGHLKVKPAGSGVLIVYCPNSNKRRAHANFIAALRRACNTQHP